MTADQLFDFMRRHRATTERERCHRCGGESLCMFRDGLERPVCYGCIFTCRDNAARFHDGVRQMDAEADEALVRRLHSFHSVAVVACPLCDLHQSYVHEKYHAQPYVNGCWYCEDERGQVA